MNQVFQDLTGVQATCGEKGKEVKGRRLQVAEWPVILQGWRGGVMGGRVGLDPQL